MVFYSANRSGRRSVATYWWREIPNAGDFVTPYILEAHGLKPHWAPPETAKLIASGSILQKVPQESTATVFGTGFQKHGPSVDLPHCKILAVRGHLTKARLANVESSVILGDPAILIDQLQTNNPSKKKVAIVPHYVDRGSTKLGRLVQNYREQSGMIDARTSDVTKVLKQLNGFQLVASTSLHGLILAWTQAIPCVWLSSPTGIVGDDFKFRDFFSAFDLEMEPLKINDNTRLVDIEDRAVSRPDSFAKVRSALANTFRDYCIDVASI